MCVCKRTASFDAAFGTAFDETFDEAFDTDSVLQSRVRRLEQYHTQLFSANNLLHNEERPNGT